MLAESVLFACTHPSSWLVVAATVKGRTHAGPSVDQMAGPACC